MWFDLPHLAAGERSSVPATTLRFYEGAGLLSAELGQSAGTCGGDVAVGVAQAERGKVGRGGVEAGAPDDGVGGGDGAGGPERAFGGEPAEHRDRVQQHGVTGRAHGRYGDDVAK